MMAHPSDQRICSPGAFRLLFFLAGLFLIGYILRPPVLSRPRSTIMAPCPPCSCDCSEETMLSIPLDFINLSFPDCGKDDPSMSAEMKKDVITLLSEEISLLKNVTHDSLEHTKALILDARKTSSHYQREAEKCTAGMETCEEARERAVAELSEERKLSALWETRAREFGWTDE